MEEEKYGAIVIGGTGAVGGSFAFEQEIFFFCSFLLLN